MDYIPCIGLEIHIQLLTRSKAFSGDCADNTSSPNDGISPYTLGMPGTLPRFNTQIIDYALCLAFACNAQIQHYSEFSRKNYFYPDLPKGYQITQNKFPVSTGGFINVHNKQGKAEKIALERIHIEEDAGKSIHQPEKNRTLVDLNRAGVPLLEIVTRPEISSPEMAYNFLYEIRKLVRYLGISNGNMEQGSLRCDANISLKTDKMTQKGIKCEIKNLNSLTNLKKALHYEIKRQRALLQQGRKVKQQTRGFNATKGITFAQRNKEKIYDYRFFPDPDVPPLKISAAKINEIKNNLPDFPETVYNRFRNKYNLSHYDAHLLSEDKDFARYFEKVATYTQNYKAAANWMLGKIKAYLNNKKISITQFHVHPKNIALLIGAIDEEKISHRNAVKRLFSAMLEFPDKSPGKLAEQMDLLQLSDEKILTQIVREVIKENPKKAAACKKGKKALTGMFMGEVMKKTQGKAHPQKTKKIINQLLC